MLRELIGIRPDQRFPRVGDRWALGRIVRVRVVEQDGPLTMIEIIVEVD